MKISRFFLFGCAITCPSLGWAGACTSNGYTPGANCGGLYPGSAPGYLSIDPVCRSNNTNCKWRECYNQCHCTTGTYYDCCAGTAEAYDDLTRIRMEDYGGDINAVSVYEFQPNEGQYTCELELLGHKCAGGYFGDPVQPYELSNIVCTPCDETLWDGDTYVERHVNSFGPTPATVNEKYWSWDNIETDDEFLCYIEAGYEEKDNTGTFVYVDNCYYE